MRQLSLLFFCLMTIGCTARVDVPTVPERESAKGSITREKGSKRHQQTNHFVETFDSATSISETHFSQAYYRGIGPLSRGSGRFSLYAPSDKAESPAVGNKELRYREEVGKLIASHSFAVAPVTAGNEDSLISAYVRTDLTETFGGRTAGLMSRTRGNSWEIDAYVAQVSFGSFGHNSVRFSLALMKEGKMHISYPAARSGRHSLKFTTDKIYVEMRTVNDRISASFWRVNASGKKSLLTTLSIQDDTLRSGGNGLFAFARKDKSLFFDDVRVEKLPNAR